MSNYSSQTALSLLPPTSNPWLLKGGDLALYNSTLLIAANSLFQHAFVFGFIFLLRGFSSKRATDLHFLSIVFALSFIAAPLIFLIDTKIDSIKLWFFLEHEAIEYLIAIRVLTPVRVLKYHAGLVVFLCWITLSIVSIVVILVPDRHGADIIAWGALTSDGLISISGFVLIARWFRKGGFGKRSEEIMTSGDGFCRRKEAAEAMAGLGFCMHGLSTMTVGPIFDRVLYHGLDPSFFAYAWCTVFIFAFFTLSLSVPVAAIFFSTIQWCCWHDRKILPGEAQWTWADLETGTKTQRPRTAVARPYSRPRGNGSAYWTRLAEKHAKSPSTPSSIEEYG